MRPRASASQACGSTSLSLAVQDILAEVSETGRMSKIPPMFASVIEAADGAGVQRLVSSCVDYLNAQTELRNPREVTIEPGDPKLLPTQEPGRTWERTGPPKP